MDRARFRSLLLLSFFGSVLVIEFFTRPVLVDHVPFPLTLAGMVCGAAVGVWAAVDIHFEDPENRSIRRRLALLALPFFAVVAGTYLTRFAVERTAFVGAEVQKKDELGLIVGKTRGRRSYSRRFVRFEVGPDSREMRVLATYRLALNVSSNPGPSPYRSCLAVTVETGRFGVRRIVTPNYFDDEWGMERLRRCRLDL